MLPGSGSLCVARLGVGRWWAGSSAFLGQKGSLEGDSQVSGSLRNDDKGGFLYICVSLGPAEKGGTYVAMRGSIHVCQAPNYARLLGALWGQCSLMVRSTDMEHYGPGIKSQPHRSLVA